MKIPFIASWRSLAAPRYNSSKVNKEIKDSKKQRNPKIPTVLKARQGKHTIKNLTLSLGTNHVDAAGGTKCRSDGRKYGQKRLNDELPKLFLFHNNVDF